MTANRPGIRFGFPAPLLPDGVAPGTNILVSGATDSGARSVALGLTAVESYRNESQLLLSADVCGRELLDEADAVTDTLDPSRTAVIDCSGTADEDHRFDQLAAPIDGPGDLIAIETEFGTLYEKLRQSGYARVRIGVFSISSLLSHSDLQTVSRFVHMLTGRVIATGDLGVFHIDSSLHPDVAVDVFEHFCDLRVEVRRTEEGEVQVRTGAPGAELDEWDSVTPLTTSSPQRRS
ncbi:DUF7504 family protein [Haloarcula salinisoli]|uniref:RecA-superfamily ATPase, KaiC/GvpD/RAD55 family n=1 Tax=Haloarcula salinisoli TaxID=2487746 RepID=A0A8J7YDM7_9EURY|nr:hypothetical protein [Halomicroarcula salinisoli]MBX0286853.1 hypothetical protein [Halomicroarcula salinisoli]MBX0304155.1 hypothetical protein [Halomicroarcula salinisoli]